MGYSVEVEHLRWDEQKLPSGWEGGNRISKPHSDALTITFPDGTESCKFSEPIMKSIGQKLVKIAGVCVGVFASGGAYRGAGNWES